MAQFTYNFNTDPLLSSVRMLVADTDITHVIFDDDEVSMAIQMSSSQGIFISAQGVSFGMNYSPVIPIVNSPYRAAALLLDSLAANKSRLSSIQRLLDVQLNPEKAAQECRKTAKEYRDLAANDGSFAIAEMVTNEFSARERVEKQMLRLYGSS